MAQLTIYVDENTRSRVEDAARAAGVSVSKWVKQQLEVALADRWPADYFNLFGSLADTDLPAPDELCFEQDTPRESL